MINHRVGAETTSLHDIAAALHPEHTTALTESATANIQKCRAYLEKKIAATNDPVYGINTGFGSLCDVKISGDQLTQLQHNLVNSHACGMGDTVPADISRLILFLKIKNMALGHSGVRVELVERMLSLYNAGAVPELYELGSLGASGDLAPLAHLGLLITSDGFQLREKEGLAILNGTQFSLAYAAWCTITADRLYQLANTIAVLSLDAYDCMSSPFDPLVHEVRPHKGQLHTAHMIDQLWQGSSMQSETKQYVQDPYSFRCIPQVHGATYDAILHLRNIVTTEINSVTDNPLIFPDADKIVSGGNFHAQPLAMAVDYLSTAVAELGSIAERRIYQLINGDRGLPQFLVQVPGLNSGFMIAQYTAASIVSKNKQLATPASVDSIVSCKGQEDHVSMAANAGTACYRIVQNVKRVLSLELLVAAQALEFRRPATSSPAVEELVQSVRVKVPFYDRDRPMTHDIKAVESVVDQYLHNCELTTT